MLKECYFRELLEDNPIIAAVKDDKSLNEVLKTDSKIIFLLYGDILSIRDMTEKVLSKGKIPFIHLDMVTGFAPNPVVIDYIVKNFNRECGVITTKVNIVKKALESNVKVVQRFFLVDSMSIESTIESLKKVRPDAIEIMPGIMPKVIKRISEETRIPIIAGGLIDTKEEVMSVLKNGGLSVSTTNAEIWKM